MSLRFHGEAANSGEPTPAKKRGRGRGRRRRAASRGDRARQDDRRDLPVSLRRQSFGNPCRPHCRLDHPRSQPGKGRSWRLISLLPNEMPHQRRRLEMDSPSPRQHPANHSPLPSQRPANPGTSWRSTAMETSAADHPAIAPIPDQSPLPEIASATTGSEIPTPTPPSQPEGGAPESPEPTAVEVAPEKPPASPPAEVNPDCQRPRSGRLAPNTAASPEPRPTRS